VLENSLGGEVVWSYEDAGLYQGTLSGAFPSAKTIMPAPPANDYGFTGIANVYLSVGGENYLVISTDNGAMVNCLIQILVYP
jgi:hypothetical protein